MAKYVETKYPTRRLVIDEALDIVGQPAKRAILTYLCRKNIIIGADYCSPINEIQAALEGLLGSSAALIMRLIEAKELEYH